MRDYPRVNVPALPRTVFAGLPPRFIAWLIDDVVVASLIAIVVGPIYLIFGPTDLTFQPFPYVPFLTLVSLPYVLYHGTALSTFETTVGKWAMGLLVVDGKGQPLKFGVAMRRSLGYFISLIVFGAGFIVIPFTQHKQGFHDRIADSYVVHRKHYFAAISET